MTTLLSSSQGHEASDGRNSPNGASALQQQQPKSLLGILSVFQLIC